MFRTLSVSRGLMTAVCYRGNTVLGRFRQRQAPWERCPHDGEVYRAPSFFDLTHVETVDGVACGRQGVEIEELG